MSDDDKTQFIQAPAAEGPANEASMIGIQIIGTYEIDKFVAVGGMGEVYRGSNIHTGEPVAIKIVLPALAHDPEIFELFQKEATILGRLAHEAVVRYHVFTIDPTLKRPCLVMEFVDGGSMADYIKTKTIPPASVRSMLHRLASGLHQVHSAGVIHRDLSPDNIILQDDDVDQAKIIDFGIAKSTKAGDKTLIGGRFAGKFNYVSPEQLGRFKGVITDKSDVYSLALVAVAACLGRSLDMGDSPADAVEKRMSVPDLTGVDESLRPLLEWMLQPDPADRPASMAEVVQLLSPGQTHPPAGTMPPVNLPGVSSDDWSTPPGAVSRPPSFDNSAPPQSQPPQAALSQPPQAAAAPPPEDDSASPFGPYDPPSTPPVEQIAAAAAAPEKKKSGGGFKGFMFLLLLSAAGGGGAYYMDLLPWKRTAPPVVAVQEPEPAEAETTETPEVETATEETPPATPEPVVEPSPTPTETVTAEAETPEPETPEVETPEAVTPEAVTPESVTPVETVQPTLPETTVAETVTPTEIEAVTETAETTETATAADTTETTEEVPVETPPAEEEVAVVVPPVEPTPPTTAVAVPEPTQAEKINSVGDKIAWLDEYDAGACVYTSIQSVTNEAVLLEGFAKSTDPLVKLMSDFEAEHGIEPDIGVRVVKDSQCPVLSFLNRLADAEGTNPTLKLDKDVLVSGDALRGTVTGTIGKTVLLLLIDDKGVIYNISSRLRPQDDGSETFGLKLTANASNSGTEAPHMILAVSLSDNLGGEALPARASSDTIFPRILGGVLVNNLEAGASLQYFRFDLQ